MPKFGIEIEGLDDIINQLDELGADIKEVAEKALKATHEYVTNEVENAIKPHKYTGATEKSIKRKSEIGWNGSVAESHVGFDISKGGLPSIFLMYGTPRMKKDQKLYNAIFGKKTNEKIRQIQEDIFFDAIRKVGG